jgi:hypothetical protein
MTVKEQEPQLSKPSGIESGTSPDSEADIRSGTGFWSVVQSVAAAMIGVQSSKNKERDFTHGKPIHFIVGGVVGTLMLLLVIWLVVQYLLATS